jgi:hypothetical protein
MTESEFWKGRAPKSFANSDIAGLDFTDIDRDSAGAGAGKTTGLPSRKCGIIWCRWGMIDVGTALVGRGGRECWVMALDGRGGRECWVGANDEEGGGGGAEYVEVGVGVGVMILYVYVGRISKKSKGGRVVMNILASR